MHLLNFLTQAQSPSFWQTHPNLCFTGKAYESTWFYMLFEHLRKKNLLSNPYQRLFTDSMEKNVLHGTLGQSILGATSFFWLGEVSDEKETKQSLELIDFLIAYKGPHSIAYFINQSSKALQSKNLEAIILPHEITLAIVIELAQFFGISLDAKKKTLLKNIFSSESSLSLDQACMLIQYLELISTKYIDDYAEMLSSMVGSTPSLNILSEYFFSKNTKAFFATWSKIHASYPDVFWITFWAEQIWKAYFVIDSLKQKNFVLAKKMSYRLPYTFINRDWQKTESQSLINAYNFLYQTDYALKTGSTFYFLDLFYANYFNGKF